MNRSSSLLVALAAIAFSRAGVLALAWANANPSKIAKNPADDRIIQILSAFNCRFSGLNIL